MNYFLPFAALLAFFPLVQSEPPKSAAPPTVRLTVRVTGLRNDKGTVALTLFKGAEGFPNNDRKAHAQKTVVVEDGFGPAATTASAIFASLPPGEYALALLHDENKNGKMDTSLGYPLEGFGVSNNPRPRWGEPRYKDARFVVSEKKTEQTIEIKMVYL